MILSPLSHQHMGRSASEEVPAQSRLAAPQELSPSQLCQQPMSRRRQRLPGTRMVRLVLEKSLGMGVIVMASLPLVPGWPVTALAEHLAGGGLYPWGSPES